MYRIGFISLDFSGIPCKITARRVSGFLSVFLPMLLLAGSAAAQSTGCAPNTPNYPCAYVASSDGNNSNVSVLNNSGLLITTITLVPGPGPAGIAITPDNSTVYAADSANAKVYVIATSTNTVTTSIALSGNPAAIAITPNGQFAYVTEPGVIGQVASFIDVIDTSNNTIATTITALTYPTGIAIAPGGTFAYVADQCGSPNPTVCVDVINLSNNQVTTTILIGGTSANQSNNSIAITPDGVSVYVSADTSGETEIYPIATSNNSGGTGIDTGGGFLPSPFGFAISPNGILYAGLPRGSDDQTEDTVYPVNTSNNTKFTAITVGNDPTGLAVGRSGGIVYVTNAEDSTVSIIATGNNSVILPIAVGIFPQGVAAMRVSALPLINEPLVPTATPSGGGNLALTVNGTGFAPNSVVNWNGTALPTQFVSQGQLTATVLANNIASFGSASITVTTAAPGGGTSNAIPFMVTSPTAAPTFATLTDAVGTSPGVATTADFNNDGKPDLAVIDENQTDACYTAGGVGTISILVGNGDGTFTAAPRLCLADSQGTVGTAPLVAGDFNGDGRIDLAATYTTQGVAYLEIFLGNGDGTFAAGEAALGGFNSIGVVITGDFNGDGKLDLAMPVDQDGASLIAVLFGDGQGNFSSPSFSNTPLPIGTSLVAGDFNGDGILDLAVAASGTERVTVMLGNGDGTFSAASTQPTNGLVTPQSVTAGDFNGDGKLDLAFADSGSEILTVLLGNGDGTFTEKSQPSASPDSVFVSTADFNGDGKLDLALVGTGGSVFVNLGNGDGTFQANAGFGVGAGPLASAFADFNSDGRLDLAVVNFTDNTVSILQQSSVISPSSPTLAFGNQIIDTPSTPQNVSFTNSGSAPLSFGPITIGAGFGQTNNCPTPLVLVAGASCTFTVIFTPTTLGSFAGTLSLGVALPAPSVTSVSLTGTGTPLPVQITTQPASQTINAGQTAMLTVTATGTASLTYQWFLGASGNTTNPISGATSAGFTTPALAATTSYWVRVANGAGPQNSNTATITVVPQSAPQITTQPASQTIGSGQTAMLTVVATGTAPLTYQWFLGASGTTTNPISGATGASFTTPALAVTTSYWVRVSNTVGIKNSNTATITIAPTSVPPTCANLAFGPGASGLQVQFTATCSASTAATSINWGDDSALTGGSTAAVSSTHTYAAVGAYSVTVTATDSLGQSGASGLAQVTLVSQQAPPPVFGGQSSDTPLMLAAPPNSTNNPSVKFECTVVTTAGGTAQPAANLGLTCTSDPVNLALTGTPQAVTISIQTAGTATELRSPLRRHLAPFYASWLAFPGLMFMGLWTGVGSRRKSLRYVALGLLACLLIFAVSCGGGFTPPPGSQSGTGSGKATPAGKYFVTVVDVPAQGAPPPGFVQTSLIVPLVVTGQ